MLYIVTLLPIKKHNVFVITDRDVTAGSNCYSDTLSVVMMSRLSKTKLLAFFYS